MQPPTRHAFTLFEIIAALVLVTVITGFAISILPRSEVALPTEANRLATHLRHTQIRAQADIYDWQLRFTDSQTYELGPIITPGPGFTRAAIPGSSTMVGTLAGGIIVNPDTEIRFDSWGRPVNVSGAPIGSDQTIQLTEGDRTTTITIHAITGLVP